LARTSCIAALVLLSFALLGSDGGSGAAVSEAARRGWEPAQDDAPAAHDIAARAADQLRADSTFIRAEMTIVSPRLAAPRVVTFENWDDRGGKSSFIHILRPAKDRDTTFLKLEPNLWMYVPRVERTMRIPPSMMLQSWMGSDFTNDDLVRDSSEVDDYDHLLLGVDRAPEGHPERSAYVVQYTPHEGAPVVWSRIVTWIDTERYAPLRQEFYDEAGTALRVMRFSDFRTQGDRYFPHRWEMRSLEKKGHSTVIRVDEVNFEPEIGAGVFTKRNLTRHR